LTPKDEKARHVTQLHRRLSEEVGQPALREHLGSVTTMMKLSATKEIFMDGFDAIHPRYGVTIRMALE